MNDPDRRSLLQAAAASSLAGLTGLSPAQAASPAPVAGPVLTGPRLSTRTPGKPGDFDFLTGRWKILNHKRKASDKGETWDVFEGEARVVGILAGIGSVEELLIPARNFSGLGLRLLDVKAAQWFDHWVNANSGVIGPQGLPGSFEGGAGLFESEETQDGQTVIFRSVWDRISANACRWQQGNSRDGGKTWLLDWSMEWTRLG